MYKPYDSGLLIGRFQTFHIGHQSLVDAALKLCDRLVLMIGSSQESMTERNPYNVFTREFIIREIYGDGNGVILYPISDMSHENDIRPEWGRYLLEHCHTLLFKAPELMIYGNDESRSRWFDTEDIKNTSEFIVPRSRIPISATELRRLMVFDKRTEWMKWVDPKLHKHYPRLREELLAVSSYKDLYDNRFHVRDTLWTDLDKSNLSFNLEVETIFNKSNIPQTKEEFLASQK